MAATATNRPVGPHTSAWLTHMRHMHMRGAFPSLLVLIMIFWNPFHLMSVSQCWCILGGRLVPACLCGQRAFHQRAYVCLVCWTCLHACVWHAWQLAKNLTWALCWGFPNTYWTSWSQSEPLFVRFVPICMSSLRKEFPVQNKQHHVFRTHAEWQRWYRHHGTVTIVSSGTNIESDDVISSRYIITASHREKTSTLCARAKCYLQRQHCVSFDTSRTWTTRIGHQGIYQPRFSLGFRFWQPF